MYDMLMEHVSQKYVVYIFYLPTVSTTVSRSWREEMISAVYLTYKSITSQFACPPQRVCHMSVVFMLYWCTQSGAEGGVVTRCRPPGD